MPDDDRGFWARRRSMLDLLPFIVLFGAVLGALVLKEPFGRSRIAAAAVIAGGAVLLNLGD